MEECKACGKCCKKEWLVHLTNKHELKLFKDQIVFGEYVFTNKCKFLKKSKCTIHNHPNRPYRCKEYFCEGREFLLDK
jgi:Fe-S-cluster containining protein